MMEVAAALLHAVCLERRGVRGPSPSDAPVPIHFGRQHLDQPLDPKTQMKEIETSLVWG
jgi:hypothetical protein